MAPAAPKPLTRSRAWVCVGMNQLAFPGVGTVWAGRKIGYVQSALMLLGFCLIMFFMLNYFMSMFAVLKDPTWDGTAMRHAIRNGKWFAYAGCALSAVSWTWALVSSLQILAEAQKAPPPLPNS